VRKRLALLSNPDLVALADISYRTAMAESADAAADVLSSVKSLIPVRSIICALARLDAQKGRFEVTMLLNVGCPSEWLALYRSRRYDRVDPVLRRHYASYTPQAWSQTYKTATTVAERRFIEASSEFGLRDGMTLGIACDTHGYGSVLSFAGDDFVQTPRHQSMLEFLTPALHGVLVRLAAKNCRAMTRLTAREQEALRWTSVGKTTWEMARIIGISERTVAFHVGNAMRKLEARTRAQAIARAAALGFLDGSL